MLKISLIFFSLFGRKTVNSLLQTDTEEEKQRKRLKRLKRLLKRHRRQSEKGDELGLNDLGICLGDIMPEVREKWPNKTVSLFIHTARAPSIILSGQGGGNCLEEV